MTESPFDLNTAQSELAKLKRRGRALEKEISAALQSQLKQLGSQLYKTIDTERLLQETRRFADEREQ